MTAEIDITKEQRKTLLTLLRRFIPNVEVWAYGSRVKWTARPKSDLDLVAFATPAQRQNVSELKEALSESDLPFLVDLHVWDDVPEKFRSNIKNEYAVFQKGSESNSGLPEEWETLSLHKAGVKLIDCDHRTPPAAAVGYPYVAIPQLRAGRIDLTDVRLISREHIDEWTRKAKPTANDVVLSRRCNPGETAFVPPGLEFALGQNLVLLRADGTKVFPQFLRWLVRGTEWWEQIGKFLNVGAVFDSLRCADVPNFEFRVPPLSEQRAIANILGALDDKIELNRRINKTLEAMARALFKSWFVDFNPVRAKAEGRDSGLPKHIADLFPDSFEDSELGSIPRGWGVGPLENVLVLQRGFDLPSIARVSGAYPVLAASGPSGTHDEYMVRGPGVTTGRSGVLGNVFYVSDDFWPLNTSLWVKEFRQSSPAYAFHLLRRIDFSLFNAGSAVPTLNRNHVHTLPTLIPPMKLVEVFERIATASLDRQNNGVQQCRTLTAIRDTLLPKLTSGKLRVHDAEKFISEAING